MYGVPDSLDLRPFIGAQIDQICIGKHQITFNFSNKYSISAEGGWKLLGPDNRLLDQAVAYNEREVYRIHELLGKMVVDTKVSPPDSFTLTFENDLKLVQRQLSFFGWPGLEGEARNPGASFALLSPAPATQPEDLAVTEH